ncbi:MarR family winged helix-turn-helix transcriptional regulator [Williamsia sp.]|uniref:MarR family winged helix-turn-helix transcriptional regulator n=1 Tax=Williamsia sp. TaxID=1872085 RepID=UPI001A18D170|nr:MarR family winged helix-turn-helix transcriptional regulator [Williamsia sp.]MBJ7289920.1 winged helix-turn-helix transcriptional regulator [Williamsia sp.]
MSDTRSHDGPSRRESPHPWTQEALDALPLWTLVQAFHGVAGRLYGLFGQHDLTPTQFGVLAQLATGAVESQAELARRVLVTPQSLQVLVTELGARGLLDISGPGGRGRRRRLELTDSGWELIDRVRPGLEQANNPAHLGLSPTDSARLNRSLHTLRHHLSETVP